MGKLVVSLDGVVIKEVQVTKDKTTLGRSPYNDIVIDNLAVRGEHAVLQMVGSDVFIEDLNSTNGTYINGKAVKKQLLAHNDTVEIGKYKIKYLVDEGSDYEKTMIMRPGAVPPAFTSPNPPQTIHGDDVPPPLVQAGLDSEYRQAMDAVRIDIEQLKKTSAEGSLYAIPFGFKVRCLFKMDYAEAEYISKLRSGVKGHWSYRTIAWLMKQKMAARYPMLGNCIQATSPDIKDTLTRQLLIRHARSSNRM